MCREKSKLTQEFLVENLATFHLFFKYLDVSTLSRWERGVSNPNIEKKLKIIEFFQEKSGFIFPYFELVNFFDNKADILQKTMDIIIGENRELILNFPSQNILEKELKIRELKDIKNINNIIDISLNLDQEFTHAISLLKDNHFKKWANHPSSCFFVCEYKEQFFGLLFSLKLKTEVFFKLLNGSIQENDLKMQDFAKEDEEGSFYLLNFFSYSKKSAALLFIHFYIHLLKYHKFILEVGVGTMISDGHKLIKRLHIKHYKNIQYSTSTVSFYKSPLKDFLINKYTIKVFF